MSVGIYYSIRYDPHQSRRRIKYMQSTNPKENIPLYAISVIALAVPLSGYIFRGLTADTFSIAILFPIVLGVLR